MRLVGLTLVAVHVVLAGWALVGLGELVLEDPPWPPVSNPELPRAVLLVHWTLMLAAAGVFLGGYFLRWRHTPIALAVAYLGLAVMCAVETLGFLTNTGRYAAMAAEYAAYATILWLLFRTPLGERFSGSRQPETPSMRRTT
jgi:hypothetical protein